MSEQNSDKGKNTDKRKNSGVLKLTVKYASLILALMIFLGFVQNYFYFQSFNIGSYSYSSPFDLIFYFIPAYIVVPLRIVITILQNEYFLRFIILAIILYIIDLFLIERPIVKTSLEYLKIFWETPSSKLSNNKDNLFKIDNLLWRKLYRMITVIYISIISYFIIRLIYGLMTFNISECDYYLVNAFVKNTQGTYHMCFYFLFSIWGIFIFIRLFRYLLNTGKFKSSGNKYIFIVLFVIILMFTFNLLKMTQKVASLKNKNRIEDVTFIYNSDTISTNDSNFYIGTTKDYLFMRNFETGENKLYNVNNIKFLDSKISENQESKPIISKEKDCEYLNEYIKILIKISFPFSSILYLLLN